MSDLITHVSDASFAREVLQSETPVLLDFWAEWCGPCKTIAPILEELAATYKGKLRIAKLNIEENPQTPKLYKIQGIPALILFKNGEVQASKIGVRPKREWIQMIDAVL